MWHVKDGFVALVKWLEACDLFSEICSLLICSMYQSRRFVFIRVII